MLRFYLENGPGFNRVVQMGIPSFSDRKARSCPLSAVFLYGWGQIAVVGVAAKLGVPICHPTLVWIVRASSVPYAVVM